MTAGTHCCIREADGDARLADATPSCPLAHPSVLCAVPSPGARRHLQQPALAHASPISAHSLCTPFPTPTCTPHTLAQEWVPQPPKRPQQLSRGFDS